MDPMTRRELLVALAGTWGFARQQPMPPRSDLLALDVVDLTAHVSSRKVSALDVVNAYLQQIETLNPAIAAFVTVTADRARADARAVDAALSRKATPAPLAGVPIAHKDLFETAGIRTTAGSRLYDRYLPPRDADIVRALSQAGTLMLGKTNTHELGGGVTTINPFFGTTHNPWDRARIPGGSSGGSGAAVAAGLAAAATGSDTGGSVRIPAALCGCVGFKPSFGRLSTRGLLGACPTFDHTGLLTRSVADAEVIFGALTRVARSAQPSVRVGVARNFFFDALAPDVARAVEEAIGVLRTIAADVRDVRFPIDDKTMAASFEPIGIAEIQAHFAADWKARPDAFSPAFAGVLRAEHPSRDAVAAARRALAAYRRDVAALFHSVDVVVTPTVPVTAPLIDGPIDGELILRNTLPFNATGTPALSVPCGFDSQGLPVGLQLCGPAGADTAVLALGRAFETHTNWRRRAPVAN